MLSVSVQTKERFYLEKADGSYVERNKFQLSEENSTVENMLDNIKEYLIQTAQQALREELGKGFDPGYVTRVDGKNTNDLMQVKPLGKIQYFARVNFLEAALNIYQEIIGESKVVTGQYAKANMVFFNSILIADNYSELEKNLNAILTRRKLSKDDTLRYVNIAAYARKLETLGVTQNSPPKTRWRTSKASKKYGMGGKLLKPPNGVYWNVAKTMSRKFAVLKGAKFRFELLLGNYLGIGSLSLSRGFKGATRKTGKDIGRAYVYPTIVLKIGEEGYTQ
jgi:hypothetical protein